MVKVKCWNNLLHTSMYIYLILSQTDLRKGILFQFDYTPDRKSHQRAITYKYLK